MQSVCCGCFKSIPVDERKNIFDENLRISIHSEDCKDTKENVKQIRLSDSIELITGLEIVETNQQLVNLCPACFQNVQSYLNLRTRLLISLCSSNNASISNANVKSTNVDRKEKQATRSLETTSEIDNRPIKDEAELEYPVNIVQTDTPLYDIIDNNNSLDDITKLENDEQENKTSNDLENSEANYSSSISRKIDFENQDHDIESEIDVCSGEDEEILELDDQRRAINIIEIDTSSESDIEVCDYRPIGKRFKNYHAFSPHLLF